MLDSAHAHASRSRSPIAIRGEQAQNTSQCLASCQMPRQTNRQHTGLWHPPEIAACEETCLQWNATIEPPILWTALPNARVITLRRPPPSSPPLLPPAPQCEWTLVFRQTVTPGTSWQRAAGEWSENPTEPTNEQYSILDTLEEFRMADGRFLFRLSWPELHNPFFTPGAANGNQTWCTRRQRA